MTKDEFIAAIDPLFTNLVVELDEPPEKSSGGVHIAQVVGAPSGHSRRTLKILTGTIVAAGSDALTQVQIGQRVLLSEANYTSLENVPGLPRNNRYVVAMISAVIAVIKFDSIII